MNAGGTGLAQGVEGMSPFAVFVGQVVLFVELTQAGQEGFVEGFLPALAFTFAEVNTAAHRPVFAGGAQALHLVGASVVADELREGNGGLPGL